MNRNKIIIISVLILLVAQAIYFTPIIKRDLARSTYVDCIQNADGSLSRRSP